MSYSKFTTILILLATLGCAEEIRTVSPRKPSEPQAADDGIAEIQPQQPAGLAKPETTVDIGEFDPLDGKQVVDSKVRMSNPITGALEAYQPMKEQVAGMGIDHAIRLFQALEGRYPKDHDEFMTKIIRQNNIRLPALGAGKSYEYDVTNHKLMIVMDQPAGK